MFDPVTYARCKRKPMELIDTIQCSPDVSVYELGKVGEYRNIVVDIQRTSNFEANGTLSLDIKSTTGLNRSYFGSIAVTAWQHIQFRLNGTRPGVFIINARADSNPYRLLPESANSRVIDYAPEDVYVLWSADASKVFEGTEMMNVYGERW